MLSKIHIENYAIIDRLDISFESGLNIITGETGAGKSILMGALHLILGERADTSVLQDTQKKCIIEAAFTVKNNKPVLAFFEANDLDYENCIVVRREISASGKSRSFINDTPVNLSQLRNLSLFLVDLHRQFDTLDIHAESFQREVLDALADNMEHLLALKKKYCEYTKVKNELLQLRVLQDTASRELDYHQFLYQELEKLDLKENELELAESELKLLENAGQVKSQLIAVYSKLNQSDDPIVNQLKGLHHKLQSLSVDFAEIVGLSSRLRSAMIELEDISSELETLENNLKHDPDRISLLSERISSGYTLLKKHGLQTTAQLLELMQELEKKINGYAGMSAQIEKLEKEEKKLLEQAIKIAQLISGNRKKQIHDLAANVQQLLFRVGMPNARLKIAIDETSLSESGIDEVDFLFDANKSDRFEPIAKVASGGELSRLMLAVKSLVASKLSLPTLIFDEIDTGISGEAARQTGMIMKELSRSHQIISITHQAQIAAMADSHYFVYKEAENNKVVTKVKALEQQEKITAIARMLSGEKPTAAAIANAREMVSN